MANNKENRKEMLVDVVELMLIAIGSYFMSWCMYRLITYELAIESVNKSKGFTLVPLALVIAAAGINLLRLFPKTVIIFHNWVRGFSCTDNNALFLNIFGIFNSLWLILTADHVMSVVRKLKNTKHVKFGKFYGGMSTCFHIFIYGLLFTFLIFVLAATCSFFINDIWTDKYLRIWLLAYTKGLANTSLFGISQKRADQQAETDKKAKLSHYRLARIKSKRDQAMCRYIQRGVHSK